jgi:hypothetical protein
VNADGFGDVIHPVRAAVGDEMKIALMKNS